MSSNIGALNPREYDRYILISGVKEYISPNFGLNAIQHWLSNVPGRETINIVAEVGDLMMQLPSKKLIISKRSPTSPESSPFKISFPPHKLNLYIWMRYKWIKMRIYREMYRRST